MMTRFVDKGETVLDRPTGLMWARNASLSEFPLTWIEALEFVGDMNASGFGGHDDWKLPNRRELFSLISHETINPCVPRGHPFENIFAGYYWTSTSCARLPDQAWYIHLGGAKVYRGMKYNSYMVWPVRQHESVMPQVLSTGQHKCYDASGRITACGATGQDGAFQSGRRWPKPRFETSRDYVLDRATGLVWARNADYTAGPLDWPSALDTVAGMNAQGYLGCDGWRVPRISELESLADMGCHTPALPVEHPFNKVQAYYWSGTTSLYNTQYAWVLYMQDGAVGVGYKPLPEFYLWPVSSRQP